MFHFSSFRFQALYIVLIITTYQEHFSSFIWSVVNEKNKALELQPMQNIVIYM